MGHGPLLFGTWRRRVAGAGHRAAGPYGIDARLGAALNDEAERRAQAMIDLLETLHRGGCRHFACPAQDAGRREATSLCSRAVDQIPPLSWTDPPRYQTRSVPTVPWSNTRRATGSQRSACGESVNVKSDFWSPVSLKTLLSIPSFLCRNVGVV